MNRRSFFQTALVSLGAIGFISSMAQAEERRRGAAPAAGAAPQLVDPKDSAAKAVNYVHDNSEIKDKALQADRGGVKFKEQHCSSCAFYQKDKEVALAGKKAAPCQMPFATGKVVSEKGWCTSWAKKA
jgi:hypothetical protein